MRAIIKLLILCGLAILAVFFLRNNNDVVMLITGDERRTMSLLTASLILLVLFGLFYIVVRLIAKVLSVPKALSNWSSQRHQNKDILLLERGWVELLEGRSDKAEKDLLKLVSHTNDDKRQIVASMAAARAAHNLGHFDKRDSLLADARQRSQKQPRLEAAVATLCAELLLEQGRSQEALEHLNLAQRVDGKNSHIQQLLLVAYRQTGQTVKMVEVAHQLIRKHKMTEDELKNLLDDYGAIYMVNASYDEVRSFYQSLTREEKAIPSIALAMASRYEQLEEYRYAGEALELAINQRFDPGLLAQYVKCPTCELNTRISQAQHWLSVDENNPEVLIMLGQLCLMAKLWGQSERYLTKSISLQDKNPRAHALLGMLNDRQGRPQDAIRHWRLASSATMSLVDSQQGELLAAADMSNDPQTPPDVKNLEKPDDHFLSNKVETGRGIIENTKADDELFDSAPIPGIGDNKSR